MRSIRNYFQNSRTIPGTRKLHALSRYLVVVKLYSNSGEYKEQKVVKDEGELDRPSGFITCAHENE